MEKPNLRFKFIKKHKPLLTNKGIFCLYGGRGGMKSWSVAQYLIAESFNPNSNVLCAREVQRSIEESVYKLLVNIIKKNNLTEHFKIINNKIVNLYSESDFVFAGIKDHTVDSIKSYENRKFCWFEEAQAATQKSLDILIPTVNRNKDYKLIFTYNRVTEFDAVHLLTKREDVISIYTSYKDNPFLNKEFIDEAEKMKIEDYNKWLHVYKGEPINQTDKAIISREEVSLAVDRDISDEGQIEIGVDVARFGEDRTVISKRKGHKLIDLKVYKKNDTVKVTEQVIDMADMDKSILIKVDDTGVGGGVVDQLKAKGYKRVIGLNFGEKPKDKDKYNNMISEAWFEFKELVKEVSLLNDIELLHELTTREWKLDTKGRRVIESKDEYKKRGFKSPDKADSVLICFYNPNRVSIFDVL